MRNQSVTVSAVGASNWIPVNYRQTPPNTTVAVTLSQDASLITFSVNHSYSDPFAVVMGTVARSTTTVTVTVPGGHGLVTGDSAVINNANASTGATGLDGQFTVTASSPTVFTYTSAVSGTVATSNPDVEVTPMNVFTDTAVSAKTAALENTYNKPIRAVRLNVTARTAGTTTMTVVQGTQS